MIEPPQITKIAIQQTAVIHLTIPRSQIQSVMGPAIGELVTSLVFGESQPDPLFGFARFGSTTRSGKNDREKWT